MTRDLGGETVSLCAELGLAYWQHIVALLAPIDDGELKSSHRRRRRHADAALSQVVHADVHIFRKPAGTSEAARQWRSQGCREPKGDSAPPVWGAKTGFTLQEFTILQAEREF